MASKLKKFWSAANAEMSDRLSVLPSKHNDTAEETEEEQTSPRHDYSIMVNKWQKQVQKKVEF